MTRTDQFHHPDQNIERFRTDEVLTCDGCGEFIFPTDPAYAHNLLFVVGCSRPCCRDAAEKKLAELAFEGERIPA